MDEWPSSPNISQLNEMNNIIYWKFHNLNNNQSWASLLAYVSWSSLLVQVTRAYVVYNWIPWFRLAWGTGPLDALHAFDQPLSHAIQVSHSPLSNYFMCLTFGVKSMISKAILYVYIWSVSWKKAWSTQWITHILLD